MSPVLEGGGLSVEAAGTTLMSPWPIRSKTECGDRREFTVVTLANKKED